MKLTVPQRIFFGLFFVGLFPFYLLLYYMYQNSSTQLRDAMHAGQTKRIENVEAMIARDLDVMKRESAFLASLPLMDDLITRDIDHRIDTLLTLKQNVYRLHTELQACGNEACYAATNGFTAGAEDGLHFRHDVHASFKPDWHIGNIEIFLPFSSLDVYFASRKDYWCVRDGGNAVAGRCAPAEEKIVTFGNGPVYGAVTIALEISEDVYDQPLRMLRRQLLAIALFSLAALTAFFFFVSRIVSRPIAQNIKFQAQKLELLEASRQAAEAKSRFTSQMSHEFRTPLNSIIGFSQFLEKEKLVAQEYRNIPTLIEKAGKHLLDHINQILDFSKAEQSVLEMQLRHLQVDALIEEVLAGLKPQADAKRLALTCRCVPATLLADERMLKNILINLVANGIKYTNSGHVHVSVQVTKTIKISVRDSGIGIKPEQKELLFQPFARLGENSAVQGSGLGLALASAYAERMGARLYFIGHDVGSEFVLAFKKE